MALHIRFRRIRCAVVANTAEVGGGGVRPIGVARDLHVWASLLERHRLEPPA
ncbi:hypothetical protein MMEU_1359 [Mycobacterium marinum str. Europe]|nr:hypothetical protein MMEU_1359 [Mycobacterium marinum str. Europe]